MIIRVSTCHFHRFIPNMRLQFKTWTPVKTYKRAFTFSINKAITMNTEAFNHTQTAWNAAIAHCPQEIVQCFWTQWNKIIKSIMRWGSLWKTTIRFHLDGMHQIWELNSILNKEYWGIVTHQIPVSLFSINFDGKPANITRCINRPCTTRYRRKTGK